MTYDEFIVTSNYHPYEIWGDTKDYDPIFERFQVTEPMKRPDEKKDDEEKIDPLTTMRNLNNKMGF